MRKNPEPKSGCCDRAARGGAGSPPLTPSFPMQPNDQSEEVCCGPPPSPASHPMERPGYRLQPYVTGFLDTGAGPVPQVKTELSRADRWGTIGVRLGIRRSDYTVAPGLYAVGRPAQDSPVMVSANYKLSFDTLRSSLQDVDAWVLVLDTRGINVWCAAGKQLFSTGEVANRVRTARLEEVVAHRQLILPQLAATGVSAGEVKKATGFEVVWGPVRSEDIRNFLARNQRADIQMRRVTFCLRERAVLIPVEISHLLKPTLGLIAALFVLSGVGSDIFSLQAAWQRGGHAFSAYLAGIVAGAVATPMLLPWIPPRSFSAKGALTGLPAGAAIVAFFRNGTSFLDLSALLLLTVAVSSFLAMNFTGTTPFTSPTGVEKEMRRAIPLQLAAVTVAAVIWVAGGFFR